MADRFQPCRRIRRVRKLTTELTLVAKEKTEHRISNFHFYLESVRGFIEPLVKLGSTTENHRKPERDEPALVEALGIRGQMQRAVIPDPQIQG